MVHYSRNWFSAAALVCAIVSGGMGCSNPTRSTILARAPGSDRPISTKTPVDGEFALYHVTQFNRFGQPQDAKILESYHLPRGEPIGFRWVTVRAETWHPEASLHLEAYAGDHADDLGPITSMTEKYYWANAAQWSHYWTIAPAVGFTQRVTGQN